MSLHLIDPIAITCFVNFGARCYKIYGKCKIFLMPVYMIFKYSKRFRYAPSFNKNVLKEESVKNVKNQNFKKTLTLYVNNKEGHHVVEHNVRPLQIQMMNEEAIFFTQPNKDM